MVRGKMLLLLVAICFAHLIIAPPSHAEKVDQHRIHRVKGKPARFPVPKRPNLGSPPKPKDSRSRYQEIITKIIGPKPRPRIILGQGGCHQ
jgi:hypothetical protein